MRSVCQNISVELKLGVLSAFLTAIYRRKMESKYICSLSILCLVQLRSHYSVFKEKWPYLHIRLTRPCKIRTSVDLHFHYILIGKIDGFVVQFPIRIEFM